jgi:hypothetical protein
MTGKTHPALIEARFTSGICLLFGTVVMLTAVLIHTFIALAGSMAVVLGVIVVERVWRRRAGRADRA